jgi:hypothetical protein
MIEPQCYLFKHKYPKLSAAGTLFSPTSLLGSTIVIYFNCCEPRPASAIIFAGINLMEEELLRDILDDDEGCRESVEEEL